MYLPGWLLQGAVVSQFYFYGRQHFTSTGWLAASSTYSTPDVLTTSDLSEKVYIVTGGTSGVGKKVTELLSGRGATVYMVCRSENKAAAVRDEIREATKSDKVHYLMADVAVASDVRRVASEFMSRERSLNGLVCNAGALLPDRTETSEGVEVTFAAHLLHGSYLLTELLRPSLTAASEPRVVLVSSGGMYTTKWPGIARASSIGDFAASYNGQSAYAQAKRGQVLLAEEWAKREGATTSAGGGAGATFVSAHPGWCATPGVEKAYGKAKFLEPMRDLYQGAEGIAWLAAAPAADLRPGAFYLDRAPQPKHMARFPLDRSGSFTSSTDAEVAEFMASLEELSSQACARPPAGGSPLLP